MNTRQLLKLGVLLVAMLMLFVGSTFATTYYVNIQTGLDTKDGLTPANAKHSIGNAIAAAAPGDVISVDWANGNPYLENITVDKVLTFARTDSDPSSISVTSWTVNIVAHVGANSCTFTGKFLFPNGLTILDGQIYGASFLTVQTNLVRWGQDLTVALASRHSTVVDGQIVFTDPIDIMYFTQGFAMATGGDLPATGTHQMHNFITNGTGAVTLNESKWMNGGLTTGGVLAIGSANTLTIDGNNVGHTTAGDVTGGTLAFTMNGATTIVASAKLPNITTSGSNLLTVTGGLTGIGTVTANGTTSITVGTFVGGSGNYIGAVTNNSTGAIILTLAQYITSLSNTSTGNIAVNAAGVAIDVSGSVLQNGTHATTSYIDFSATNSTVYVHGAVTNSNGGYINFAPTADAATTVRTGAVLQSSSGSVRFAGGVTAASVTNSIAGLTIAGSAKAAGDNYGVIRFSSATAVVTVSGLTQNIVTYSGTAAYNSTGTNTDWQNTGEITFASTGGALTLTGGIDVFATGSYSSSAGSGAAVDAIVSNNGSVIISATANNLVIGPISDRTNWLNVSHVTSNLNGIVSITALTTGTLGTGGTRIGAVSNTSITSAFVAGPTLGNGHILLGGVSTAVTFYGTSVSSSGGHGGQVLVANITVNLSSNVVNSRTVAGEHIQFGSAPTLNATVTVGGTIQNLTGCASTTTFPVFEGNNGENFTIGAIDCKAGTILVGGDCQGSGVFGIQTISITGGTVTLGSGSGSRMNVVVSGNTNFIGGTFNMATDIVGEEARILELDGYTHIFSSASGRTNFMANVNCQIHVVRTASFVAPQTLTGNLTETIWPGSLLIDNSTGIPGVAAVIFNGGNFRFLRDVTFNQGLVNLNNMHIFIGGQDPGPAGAGNFLNTPGYTTIGDGFITINGDEGQTVTGAGDFGNFEVDAVGPVAVQGKFVAIFGLTHGEVTGGTLVEFNNPSPYPTIRRNDGEFDSEPLFTTMVNVIYIGVDKSSSLELPTAEDKLNNLTVSTTNGLNAVGGAGKGTVKVDVETYVNGRIYINPGQALCLDDVDLIMKGDSIILNGDIASMEFDDELWLARAAGTVIKGAGALPPVHVDAGSTGNLIDGSVGLAQYLLGGDGWRGGAATNDDYYPGFGGLLVVGHGDGGDTAQIYVKFGTPNTTSKVNIGCFDNVSEFPGLIVTRHGRLDLQANLIVKGVNQRGDIRLAANTLTDRGEDSYFYNTSSTTGTGVLRFEPDESSEPEFAKVGIVANAKDSKQYQEIRSYLPTRVDAKRTISADEMKSIKSPRLSKGAQSAALQPDQWMYLHGEYFDASGPVTIATNVTLASRPDGDWGVLEQVGEEFIIGGNLRLDSISIWDADETLTVTGQAIRVAEGCEFWTGDAALCLNPTVPPLTYTSNNDWEWITNLIVSNSVKLISPVGGGFEMDDLLHNGGELNYSDPDIWIYDNFTRTAGTTYLGGDAWFVFAGNEFDQDTSNCTIRNLWFYDDGEGPVVLTNTGIVTVSNKLKLETGLQPIDINNDVVPAGTRLAVAQLDTVVYVGGEFDVQPIYTAPITLITELTTTRTIHETVWPASALLVDTLIINNDIEEVVSIKAPAANKSAALALPWVSTSLMPGNRQINKCLDLRSGILGLDGSTVTLVDSLVIRRRQTAWVETMGGAFAFGMTNVVYEPTAASPAGDIETGPELNSTVNNLTLTRIGTPGNAMTYLDKNLTVNGTLRVANNFDAGDWTLTLNGHMIVTAPQLSFDGTLIFGGALPIQTVQLNGTLSPTNLIMGKTVIGTVNVTGGNIDVETMLTFINGVLNIAPPWAVIINKPHGGGQGFDHTGVVYGAALSHVRGKVQQLVPAGAGVPGNDGRFEYPVGSWARYRPLAFTFTPNYPAINTTNIVVMDVDTIPEGTKDMPINGGYGVKIRNYPHYFWLVNATPSSFTQTQQFDVELHGMDLIYPDVLKDEMRIIRRQDGSALINGWSMQGDSTTYTANYVYRPDPINYPNDSVVVVRSSSTYGAIVLAGTRFAIGIPARNPEFLASMPDTSVAQVDSISYTYRAKSNNIDGAITSYQLVSPPAGATITTSGNPLQAVVKYKPGYATTPGVHAITVAAFDGTLSKQTTSNVTVIKSNRSPVFTSELAVDTVVERTALSFTYAATDPDGDVVTYTMPDTTFGARLTGTVLSWTPTFAQAGRAYIVKVIASDGLLADTATKSVFVKHSRSKGDVNGTGTVSTLDATLILQFVVGIEPGKSALLDPAAAWAADVTGDGTVSALDAAYILQYLAHKRTLPTTPNILAKPVIASGTLGWGNLVAGDAGTMTLPMKVTGASNIYSVQFKANIGALKVSDLKANLPKDWMISWYSADGKLMVAAAGVSPINDGTIATICFQVEKDQKPEKIEAEVQMNESTTQALSAQVAALPTQFALENNYPNPFNPTTTIKYQLPEDVRVSVTVYNIQGQVVRTLVNEDQKAGYYTIQWDGRSEAGMTVATGIYIYRIDAGTFVTAKKMVMMK